MSNVGCEKQLRHPASDIPHSTSHIRHGFTLVELLMVVAIIALLIAVLLPSLTKARAAAKAAVCMTHLHQIGVAVIAYATDNNNSAVPAMWTADKTGAGGGPPGYPGGAAGYYNAYPSDSIFLGQYTDPQFGNAFNTTQLDGRVQRTSVWRCPEDRTILSNGIREAGYAEYRYAYPMGYPTASGGTSWGDPGHTNILWKLSAARSPAKLLSFVDSSSKRFDCGGTNLYGNTDDRVPSWSNPLGTPGSWFNHAIRHPNHTTNVLFIDSHIQTLPNEPAGDNRRLYPAYQRGEFVLLRDQS
ncbi:MAG: type II secretion system protein [Phycisphaerales bacterium]